MSGLAKICVSVMAPTLEQCGTVLRSQEGLADMADIIEIRLDGLDTCPPLSSLSETLGKYGFRLDLLLTNRPRWEGGQSTQSEEDRIARLVEAAQVGIPYVDVELRAAAQVRDAVIEAAQTSSTQVIVSHHDFEQTRPAEELIAVVDEMIASGADLGKLVSTAQNSADVLKMFTAQLYAAEKDFPFSGFCMGEHGQISRFATRYLGGQMTYVAPDPRQATAPGQISVMRMHQLCTLFEAHED